MIHAIIDNVKNKILDLKFVERYGGIVIPVQQHIEGEDGRTERITFPASCDPQGKTCYAAGDYYDLAPSDRYKSVSYFELRGDAIPFFSRIARRDEYRGFTQTVRFVAWLNLLKLGEDETCNTLADHLSVLTMNAMEGFHDIQGIDYIKRARIKLVRKVQKSMDVFSQYTYSDEQQLMLYPFDFFAMDFEIEWHVKKDCVPEEMEYTPIDCFPTGEWTGGGDIPPAYNAIWGKIGGDIQDQTDLWDILQDCCANGNKAYNISSTDVTDNNDGTFTLTVVDPSTDGMAFDELGNVYEYDGTDWTLKHSGGSSPTLYTADGVLSGHRTVNMNNNRLTFNNGGFAVNSYYSDGEALFRFLNGNIQLKSSSFSNNTTIAILLNSIGVQINTDQPNINTGNKYLKRDTTGNSKWEDLTVPEYASDTAADNDAALASGAMYSVTGSKYVKAKGAGSNQIEPVWQTLTDAATVAWNMDNGIMAEVTLGGNRTIANPTNLKKGTYSLLVKQDATGGRTLAFGSNYKWGGGSVPVVAAGANEVSLLTFVSDGTNLYGASIMDYS